jgi:hypothetical protein
MEGKRYTTERDGEYLRTPREEKRSLRAVEGALAGVIEANTEVVTEVSGSEV